MVCCCYGNTHGVCEGQVDKEDGEEDESDHEGGREEYDVVHGVGQGGLIHIHLKYNNHVIQVCV